jgi:hypothetical protein
MALVPASFDNNQTLHPDKQKAGNLDTKWGEQWRERFD